MDAIIALGHFCEVHGPCVVLCTQSAPEAPPAQQPLPAHCLTVAWCNACESLPLDQAFASSGGGSGAHHRHFLTTRTPMQQELAFLLRQATVRSLSCELHHQPRDANGNNGDETSGGPLYFGDAGREHVLSYTFSVHDALARGFTRKYVLLVLTRDKLQLLHAWPQLVPTMKRIARDLVDASQRVNTLEQSEMSQRAARQMGGNSGGGSTAASPPLRSLVQLTALPAVYGQLHLWFAWLLGCPIAVETPPDPFVLPQIRPSSWLRILAQDMGTTLFNQVCYCILTGVPMFIEEQRTREAFKSLLPADVEWPASLKYTTKRPPVSPCIVYQTESGWTIRCPVTVPELTPALQRNLVKALGDTRLPESALQAALTAIVLRWWNTLFSLTQSGGLSRALLLSMDVTQADVSLVLYWAERMLKKDAWMRFSDMLNDAMK